MKRIFASVILLALSGIASAASVGVSWTLPLTATDGTPLTGSQVLTSVQVFLATSPILDTSTAAPTVTLTAAAQTTTQTITAAPGATIYARVKACNSAGCSVFSTQASKVVPVAVPGVPTNVTVTLNIEP